MEGYRPLLIADLLTPYASDKTERMIDSRQFENLYRHVSSAGIGAFLVHSTTGEALGASPGERLDMLDEIRRNRHGKECWYVGTGLPDEKETISMSQKALDSGANGVFVVTPDFWGMRTEGWEAYFSRVLGAGLPTYIHLNQRGNPGSLDWISRKACQHKNFEGVLTEDMSLLDGLKERLAGRLSLYCGDDRLICDAIRKGMGAVSGWSNCFPDEVAFMAGKARFDRGSAGRVQGYLNEMIERTAGSGRFGTFHPVAWQKAAMAVVRASINGTDDRRLDVGRPFDYPQLSHRPRKSSRRAFHDFRSYCRDVMDGH